MPKKKARTTRRSSTVQRTAPPTREVAASTATASTSLSFVQLLSLLVGMFIANSLVVYLAHLLFPSHIVLGTHQIDPWSALFMAMAVLSVVIVGVAPVVQLVADIARFRLSYRDWMVLYLVINTLTLWFIGRMAELIGMGLSSWLIVVLLGLILTGVQGLVQARILSPQPNRGA